MGSLPVYGGTFAQSYSVSRFGPEGPESLSLTLQSLLFSISLLFSLSDFPCSLGAFFLPFPRILGVPRREKPLLFWGKTLAVSKKARVGGSGLAGGRGRSQP